jgi:phospholipase C
VTPSGGSATGGACLSILSSIPVPDLSGKGFTCGTPGSLAGQPSAAGSPANGSGGPSTSGEGSAAGSSATGGSSSAGGGANGQTPAACPSKPVASRLPAGLVVPQLAVFVIALFSLVAGYALGIERRRRPGAGS